MQLELTVEELTRFFEDGHEEAKGSVSEVAYAIPYWFILKARKVAFSLGVGNGMTSPDPIARARAPVTNLVVHGRGYITEEGSKQRIDSVLRTCRRMQFMGDLFYN